MSLSLKEKIQDIRDSMDIDKETLREILLCTDEETVEYLHKEARAVCDSVYGKDIYVRGLIEFTNYCKNDCYYCGIRRSNTGADRYRLSLDELLECTDIGYELGFRTYVLQGGEDPFFTDEYICTILEKIKERHPDCAITLSIGEKSRESYEMYYKSGADRYLLRHETADIEHYGKLHPSTMSLENRKRCLYDLKSIGYQVGCGFMVGSPYQSIDSIYQDMELIKDLEPHMVGIGPFIAHHATPFSNEKSGTLEDTLKLMSIIRLIHPHVLLPATTALGTIHPLGREKGIMAGGNVLMPNLSPVSVRKKYELYDDKICTGDEAAECRNCLSSRIERIGYHITVSRGDSKV